MFKNLTKRLFASKPLPKVAAIKPHKHIQKIRLFHGDILNHTDCDALVSFVSPDLSLGGPLNKAYLKLAGEDMGNFIANTIMHPKPGEAFVIPAFNMPVKNIVLAVLPKWEDGLQNEDRQMLRCYRRSIALSSEKGIRTLAFPALGFGQLNFPHIRFARFALRGILECLDDDIDEVRIVCKERNMSDIYAKHLRKLGWKSDV